jgi:D-alanyl-D-alanine carboxypeptidase
MKMKLVFFVAIFTSCTLSGVNVKTCPMKDGNAEVVHRIRQLLDSVYQKHPETKGIAVHMEAPRYQISWSGAAGFANARGTRLTPEMPANIASNTKTYIAATILRLVEMDKIKLSEPIGRLLSAKSNALLLKGGYNTNEITVTHLITNTSGIYDFVNTQIYQSLTVSNPKYRWTRNEQIELAIHSGSSAVKPGEIFAYSETNYSLLTEIIEQLTQLPFDVAVRRLLKFDKLKLNNTWFLLQELAPQGALPLVEQTAKTYNVNSYTLDYSFDAFGGGGLASTVADLAKFSQYLFNGGVFDEPSTRELLYTTVATADGLEPSYSLGLMHTNVAGYKAYGHGGFWGTQVKYIPELNLSIAVFVMERDTWPIYNILIEEVVKEVLKQTGHPTR